MNEVHAWITDAVISADSVLPLVQSPEHGAALIFLGCVRNHNEGRAVSGVHYEAYRDMAERTLREIVEEAAQRMSPVRIAAVHRIGELAVGEASIAIAASSPHRAQAFDGCRYVIEEVKERLSIWKQERYVSGESEWLDGNVPPVSQLER